MKERNVAIDMLRGISIIGMMIIHTGAYYLNNPTITFIWNACECVVPIFVFCSGYVYFIKYKSSQVHIISYLKKRIPRLMYPYYIFLLFFIPMQFIINRSIVTPGYIVFSLIPIGGVDISWLVLLFLCISILLPVISSLLRWSVVFWGFCAVAIAVSTAIVFVSFPFSYKYIMWLPWASVLFATYFFITYLSSKKAKIISGIVLGIVWLFTYVTQLHLHHNLLMINNKYPPDLFYLSYSLFMLLIVWWIVPIIQKARQVAAIIGFFSKYSYEIFFIHYFFLILYATCIHTFHISWIVYFGSVVTTTVIVQIGLNKLRLRIHAVVKE